MKIINDEPPCTGSALPINLGIGPQLNRTAGFGTGRPLFYESDPCINLDILTSAALDGRIGPVDAGVAKW